jgi:hypothetical protein
MAPTNSDPTANLTDQQYQQLVDHNNRVQAQTMATLQQKWGTYTFKQNIEIAQKYMESLPSNERAHFDRFTGNFPWTHMLNTVECLTFLFDAATGAHSIPKDGAGIARELASIENVMRTERAKYLKDPQLQARYRTLLDMKG